MGSVDPYVVTRREVGIIVSAPTISLRCRHGEEVGVKPAETECPIRFDVNVCGTTRTIEPLKLILYEVLIGCSVPMRNIYATVEVGYGCEHYYVYLSGFAFERCPKNTFISVSPGSKVSGVNSGFNKSKYLGYFVLFAYKVSDVSRIYAKLTAYADTDYGRTPSASCEIKPKYGYKTPSMSFEKFSVPSHFYVNEEKSFTISASLVNCPVVTALAGLRKVSGPGKAYWKKKDGKWYEVTDKWSFDIIEEGVLKPPHTTPDYSGGLKFDAVGTYRIVFGIGFQRYPTPNEISSELAKVIEETLGVKPHRPSVLAEKITLFTFEKEVHVEKPGKEIKLPQLLA